MKRLFALIFALLMTACLFSACGDDDTYRQPGTGTTLGGHKVTEPVGSDDNGTYSADPDGEVNPTTDDNILEDGLNDLENGIDEGIDDIEQGLGDLENGARDMLDGDMNNAGANGMNGNGDVNGTNGMNGTDAENGAMSSQTNPEGGNRNDDGMNNGATNGNSH